MKKREQRYDSSIINFLSNLKLDLFCDIVESEYGDTSDLFEEIANSFIPERREDLIVRADIDLYGFTVTELMLLAYTEGSNPKEKLINIYSLLIRNLPLSSTIYPENREKIKLFRSSDIFRIMRDILMQENAEDRSREHFWTISLNNLYGIIEINLVSKGTKEEVIVDVMEVFAGPFQKKVSKLILIHNHPSEELKPSKDDIEITNRLIKAGEMLGITITDHLIITPETYFSFTDNNLLGKSDEYEDIKNQMGMIKKVLTNQFAIFEKLEESFCAKISNPV